VVDTRRSWRATAASFAARSPSNAKKIDAGATTPEPDADAEKDTDELVQRRARLR